MKRLLVALVAAVVVSTAFSKVPKYEEFEDESYTNVFVAASQAEDLAALESYETQPSVGVPYPCNGFGEKYLSLDTGDVMMWCTNTVEGAVYFDMVMQFNSSKTAPVLDADTKIALYLNTSSNLVIVAGDGTSSRVSTSWPVTGFEVEPGDWRRITIFSNPGQDGLSFKVYLDGSLLQSGATSEFQCLTGDTTVSLFGVQGTGAIDDFVARTTDPFIQNPAATIGGEGYATYSAALSEALADATAGTTVAITLPDSSVTDGSAEHPYQICDADGLLALQNAVIANPAVRGLSFVQTADIDMTGVTGFYGIGWFAPSLASGETSLLPPGMTASNNIIFEGVYDGGGYTIANVTIKSHGYAGIFNNIGNATIKDLTVDTIAIDGTSADMGCAIVGNAYSNTVLSCLASDGDWPSSLNHNTAGIAVRIQDNTIVTGCVNYVDITTTSKRLGGIVAFAEDTVSGKTAPEGPGVLIVDCVNYGDLASSDGTRGVAGILSRTEAAGDKTTLKDCANFGELTAGPSGFTGHMVGQLDSNTYRDGGGNTFPASGNIVGDYHGKAVSNLAFAVKSTVAETDYLTTVLAEDVSLTAGETYYMVVDGEQTFTAENGTTLSFAVDTTTYSTSTLTLDVPADVTVTIPSAANIGGVSVLTGDGRIVSSYNALTLMSLVQQTTWCGTFEVQYASWTGQQCSLSTFGNPNSTFCANYVFFAPSAAGNNIKALEIGANGLVIDGSLASGEFTFPCALTGTGKLTVKVGNTQDGTSLKKLIFTGDVSEFAGSLEIDQNTANCAVYFGNAAGNGNCISVAAGSSVTVAAGKTWTAPNGFVVNGNMTVNGTLNAVNEKLYGNGTITFNNATSLVVANTWKGTYIANYKADNDAIVYLPVNAAATTVINGANGVFGGYPKYGSGAPSVAGPVTLNANWTIANGWTGTGYTTTFAKLSGSGDLTVNGSSAGTDPIYYTITELDGYTGTLGGTRGAFTIGKVNVATQPADGARVVKTNIGANGSIGDDVPLYVAGVNTGKTLKYDANGAEGAGLYLLASAATVNITVPTIEHATATVTTNGVAVAASGAGTYAVEAGAAVTITYAADAGYVLSGQSEYTIASATEGATIDVSGTSTAVEVAAVYRNDEKIAGYASLRAAVEAATAGDTVKLLADDRVSFSMDNLEVAIGKAITIDGNGFTVYGVSDYAGGAGDHDIYISGSGDVTIKNVTLAGFAGSVANNMRTYPIWTGSAYSGTLTLDNVMVENFNRTAFNLNGGTVLVTNCTITCDNTKATDFQEGIGVYLANVTIVDTTITGAGSLDENWPKAACIQLGNPNGTVPGTGTITVLGGSFAGQYGIIVASNAQNNVSVQGGSFTGSLDVEEGEAGTISITGGTFSVDPTEFCAAGYAADEIAADTWVVSAAYSVAYELGLEGATNAVDNITSYTASTPQFTLLPAGCDGYDFVAWTNSAGTVVETIAGGATVDLTLYASWSAQSQKHNAGDSIDCGSAQAATNLAEQITANPENYINVPSGVAGGSAYCSLFRGVVEGTEVKIVLTEEAADDIKEDLDGAAATIPLSALATGTSVGTQVTVDVVPGIWYSVSQGSSLTNMQEGTRVQATDANEGTMTFLLSHQDAAGFYKVNANITDAEPVPPNP